MTIRRNIVEVTRQGESSAAQKRVRTRSSANSPTGIDVRPDGHQPLVWRASETFVVGITRPAGGHNSNNLQTGRQKGGHQ